MVFVNTRAPPKMWKHCYATNGINAEAISGDVPQQKRMRMMRDFHEGTLAVVDSGTDVASRGCISTTSAHV